MSSAPAPIPTATHILLTHIPPFLRHPRNLRDLLFTTGPTKHIAYTCPIKRTASDKLSKDDKNLDVAAVIKLNHASQTMTFMRNWKNARAELKCTMKAVLWYEDGSLPTLYPERSDVDRRMLETLWETVYKERNDDEVGRTSKIADEGFVSKLVEVYRSIEHTQDQMDKGIISPGQNPYGNANAPLQGDDDKKLDRAKVAAAAGGAYDEEADPLNAPEVLEAVAQFRKKLEATQGGYKKKRAEYVNTKLEEMVKTAKEKMIQRKKEEEEKRNIPVPLPPPLPPIASLPRPDGLPPPLPIGLPPGAPVPPPLPMNLPPGAPVNKRSSDSADISSESIDKKRKIDGEANARKERVDVGDQSIAEIRAANIAADEAAEAAKAAEYINKAATFTDKEILSNSHFPLLKDDQIPGIRKFVKEQIVEYLGEEEATLIDFVMNYLKKGEKERKIEALFEEMIMVLEEDSEPFCLALFRKVVETCSQQ